MKQFLVNIWAYDHHAKFSVLSEDNPASLEQAIVDKLGEKSIVWETTGMYGPLHRITYEEVINGTDDATLERPLYTEEGSRSSMGAGTS
tara:strand:- start:224 stop:490 length:267 start_codon:yes stop_codon:yes gene_type:complete